MRSLIQMPIHNYMPIGVISQIEYAFLDNFPSEYALNQMPSKTFHNPQGAHQQTSRRLCRTNSGLSWADCVGAWLTCLSDAAAQEAGLPSFLLQLCLHRAQLGKLGTGLALEDMLPCLHMHKPAYSSWLHMATQSDGYVQHPCHCQWRTSFHYRGMC